MTKRKRIKDLPSHVRPLEKLLERGVSNVSDVELLALVIGSGTKQKNALQTAKILLVRNTLSGLALSSVKAISEIKGIGSMKAGRILAAFELGRRSYVQENFTHSKIMTTQEVLSQVQDIVVKKQEYLVALYMNARHELMLKETISIGNFNVMRVTPREIFLHALTNPCAGVIIVHNHPSGTPTPSEEDIAFTRQIQRAGELLGIPLIDHVIVASGGYFSFRDSPL